MTNFKIKKLRDMKKQLIKFFGKFKQLTPRARTISQEELNYNIISQEELLIIRGGDKEYKPIYDEPQENLWQKATMLFNVN